MTPFHCTHCQAVVFFESVACVSCGARLGFDPAQARMLAYAADGDPGLPWQPLGATGATDTAATADAAPPVPGTPCRNRLDHANCNWMVDDAAAGLQLCRSCRLTRTIPDLTVAGHAARWARIEQAKRRLLYGLQQLGLQPEPRRGPTDAGAADADDTATDTGLCFDLLADPPGGPRVRTGHDQGVITLNIAEADDAYREALRVEMHEPLRTLLGHLRHEVAHYLQFRWVAPSQALTDQCRAVFGDERADYAQALQQHYNAGPQPGWETQFISGYASAHPWEDWAETCAHWLLIVDAVETAAAWGLRIDGPAQVQAEASDCANPTPVQTLVVQQWLPVAQFLNAMNRSIGVQDSYPFLMASGVLDKLAAVQDILVAARQGRP